MVVNDEEIKFTGFVESVDIQCLQRFQNERSSRLTYINHKV